MTNPDLSNSELPVVLTVSGSDSGGGTGIQGDLKTFAAHRVFGTTAVTCVTAQTPSNVNEIHPLAPELVTAQIRAISEGFPIAAAKTGLLYNADIIRAVARADLSQGIPILVVDPVMVSSSGSRMLQADAVEALMQDLLPVARVVTPNLPEAEIICGHPISNTQELAEAAREIGDKFDVACVVNGGRMRNGEGDSVVDVLYDEGQFEIYEAPRLMARETHGCGCAFSAALTARLARGELMQQAVAESVDFVRRALDGATRVGPHFPLCYFA